jgi:hypothetical protein
MKFCKRALQKHVNIICLSIMMLSTKDTWKQKYGCRTVLWGSCLEFSFLIPFLKSRTAPSKRRLSLEDSRCALFCCADGEPCGDPSHQVLLGRHHTSGNGLVVLHTELGCSLPGENVAEMQEVTILYRLHSSMNTMSRAIRSSTIGSMSASTELYSSALGFCPCGRTPRFLSAR